MWLVGHRQRSVFRSCFFCRNRITTSSRRLALSGHRAGHLTVRLNLTVRMGAESTKPQRGKAACSHLHNRRVWRRAFGPGFSLQSLHRVEPQSSSMKMNNESPWNDNVFHNQIRKGTSLCVVSWHNACHWSLKFIYSEKGQDVLTVATGKWSWRICSAHLHSQENRTT